MSEQLLGKDRSFAGGQSFAVWKPLPVFHPPSSCWLQYSNAGYPRGREGTGTCSLELFEAIFSFDAYPSPFTQMILDDFQSCLCIGGCILVIQVCQLNTENHCTCAPDSHVWLCPT